MGTELELVDDDITEKQRRFVDAYMGEAKGNGTEAARVAGYDGSDAVLATTAWRLLRKAEIRRALDVRMESDPLIMGRVERLRKLSSIARGEYTSQVVDPETGELADVRVPAKDLIAAMKELAQAQGDHVTKLELTGKDGAPLQSEARVSVLTPEVAEDLKRKILFGKRAKPATEP